MAQTQDFKHHARLVPEFHYGVFLVLLVNFIWSAYRLVDGVTGDGVIRLLVSVALILMALSLRRQVLTVQDRVIRLEMRLRLSQLLPADLQAKALALTVKQLVALRFASDPELPGLVRDVLAGTLTEPKDIKMKVKDWQGDFLRA
jgi:hypothetical protein